MTARYTALASEEAERELDDAFDAPDNDEDNDNNAGHRQDHPTPSGAYDFEREYDYPPPGSPPQPTARALPNDYGNTNGQLPTAPLGPVAPPSPSFFRRAVGALLPSHYVRIPTSDSQSSIPRGGGTENDGVFANVTAKPQPTATRAVQNADGSIYMVPEDNQKEVPPSYADAQADAVPPYWETTVHAPATQDLNGNMIVDDLPTGSLWYFTCNLVISFFFQFIGFLFTYLLHTSHAGKYGSRAGLGLTLIQFGFYSRSMSFEPGDSGDASLPAPSPTPGSAPNLGDQDGAIPIVTPKDWLAFLVMTLGWFLFLSSVIGYWRVKRWERSIRAASRPVTAEDIQRDIEIRRNIANVFGVSFGEDNQAARLAEVRAADARLARDLRAAGLL